MFAFLHDCFHRISLSWLRRFPCMTSATSWYVRHIEKKKKKEKRKKAKQRDIAKYVQSTIKALCVTLRFDDKALLRDVIVFSGNFLSQRFSLSLSLSVLHFFFSFSFFSIEIARWQSNREVYLPMRVIEFAGIFVFVKIAAFLRLPFYLISSFYRNDFPRSRVDT